MSKYSSDSDSSSYHRKSRRKRRSYSSSSSDSSRRRRSKHHRSSRYKKSKSSTGRSYRRSRSVSKTSSRHSRSSSKDLRTKRSQSRDNYRHKHEYKSKSYSKNSSTKYYSRSTSSESKNSSASSTSKSSSNNSSKKNLPPNTIANPEEQLREKLLKAIKAAESADHQLKQQGVLPKGVKSRNDISNLAQAKPASNVISDINSDVFIQKSFKSSKNKKDETVEESKVPSGAAGGESNSVTVDDSSIFHASFFIDPKAKLDRWIKKLHQIRQRAITGEPISP